jgi:hypothetical protein
MKSSARVAAGHELGQRETFPSQPPEFHVDQFSRGRFASQRMTKELLQATIAPLDVGRVELFG